MDQKEGRREAEHEAEGLLRCYVGGWLRWDDRELKGRRRSLLFLAINRCIVMAGREVWLPVEDKAAWVRAAVVEDRGSVVVRRLDTDATVTLTAEAFEKLSLTTTRADDEVAEVSSFLRRFGPVVLAI